MQVATILSRGSLPGPAVRSLRGPRRRAGSAPSYAESPLQSESPDSSSLDSDSEAGRGGDSSSSDEDEVDEGALVESTLAALNVDAEQPPPQYASARYG